MTSTLDERLGDQIRALPGVRDVFGGLVDTVSFNELGLYGVLVQGWMPETMAFDHLRLISGLCAASPRWQGRDAWHRPGQEPGQRHR